MKTILFAVLALAAVAATTTSASADMVSEIMAARKGCDSFRAGGVVPDPCGKYDKADSTYRACRQAIADRDSESFERQFGAITSQSASFAAARQASWRQVIDMWNIQLVPTLTKEDGDILYSLILPHDELYLEWRGIAPELDISLPIGLSERYKNGKSEISAKNREFFSAFFAADADSIRKLINKERPYWRSHPPQFTEFCK